MSLLHSALRAGHARAPSTAAANHRVVVAGGGGALGSAVLETLLSRRGLAPVRVLTTRPLSTAMPGLEPVVVDTLAAVSPSPLPASIPTPIPIPIPMADTALIVFDRERHANGRELAFLRPLPDDLVPLARWLHDRGVRSLIVVLPHAPAQLPEALKRGLANLDEQSVSALGFERLVFVRSAQAPSSERAAQWLQRLADGLLAQMRLMVAPTQQPVRARKVAQFVAELVLQLPGHDPGTRVVPPELVWLAAQQRDPAPLLQAWLATGELPEFSAAPRRL